MFILDWLKIGVSWILVQFHALFTALGMNPASGWTWTFAIVGLVIVIRIALIPLFVKQIKSQRNLQLIQPQMKEIQKKYAGDKERQSQEMMKLYRETGTNPLASCLPIILQLPVFISLYAAIKGVGPLSAPIYQPSVQALSHASFLWIPELGKPDPYYILLILYVVTQMISTELMVATQSDSNQKWIMRAMPIMFVLFLFRFPAGLFVYWVTTNVWTIGQQLIIRRTMPKPEQLAAQAKAKPKKRSRFMEAMVASQNEAMKQREERVKGQPAKQGSVAAGKKPAPGAKKPPPGKVKRKQVQSSGAKPGQPGAKPGQAARPKSTSGGGQDKPTGKPADKPAGGAPEQGARGATTSADGPADE